MCDDVTTIAVAVAVPRRAAPFAYSPAISGAEYENDGDDDDDKYSNSDKERHDNRSNRGRHSIPQCSHWKSSEYFATNGDSRELTE